MENKENFFKEVEEKSKLVNQLPKEVILDANIKRLQKRLEKAQIPEVKEALKKEIKDLKKNREELDNSFLNNLPDKVAFILTRLNLEKKL